MATFVLRWNTRLCGMSEVGSGMNIGSDYSGTEKTEKTDKATLRHHILSRRKRVPAEERGAAGELLVRRFPAHMIQDGPTVAAYVSMGSEIEPGHCCDGCGSWLPRVGAKVGVWVGNWLECAGFIGIIALDGCSGWREQCR